LRDTDAAHPVLKRLANTSWKLDKGLHMSARCIYIHSLQVNPPNPAICHGSLRLPLRGGHGHVPRSHVDPISLYNPRRSSPGARAHTAPNERALQTHGNFRRCAGRNVVDENVRIVIPQTHTLDVTLAALAHTGCHAATLYTHRQV